MNTMQKELYVKIFKNVGGVGIYERREIQKLSFEIIAILYKKRGFFAYKTNIFHSSNEALVQL